MNFKVFLYVAEVRSFIFYAIGHICFSSRDEILFFAESMVVYERNVKKCCISSSSAISKQYFVSDVINQKSEGNVTIQQLDILVHEELIKPSLKKAMHFVCLLLSAFHHVLSLSLFLSFSLSVFLSLLLFYFFLISIDPPSALKYIKAFRKSIHLYRILKGWRMRIRRSRRIKIRFTRWTMCTRRRMQILTMQLQNRQVFVYICVYDPLQLSVGSRSMELLWHHVVDANAIFTTRRSMQPLIAPTEKKISQCLTNSQSASLSPFYFPYQYSYLYNPIFYRYLCLFIFLYSYILTYRYLYFPYFHSFTFLFPILLYTLYTHVHPYDKLRIIAVQVKIPKIYICALFHLLIGNQDVTLLSTVTRLSVNLRKHVQYL